MLHHVVLGGNQHRAAEGIQICVMQLVWQPVNFVRRVHVDVSDSRQKRSSASSKGKLSTHTHANTDRAPSGRMTLTVRKSMTWSSYTWSTSLIFSAYWSPSQQKDTLVTNTERRIHFIIAISNPGCFEVRNGNENVASLSRMSSPRL